MFKNKKNLLDEMQEQKLLHIEKNGCWFAYWALLVSMIIQVVVYKEDVASHIAGEWIVFMCLCFYIAGACLKAGIWDRRLKADANTNAVCSAVAGVITAIISGIISYVNFGMIGGAVAVGVINFAFITVICFIALTICTRAYKKRLEKMEEEPQEQEFIDVEKRITLKNLNDITVGNSNETGGERL